MFSLIFAPPQKDDKHSFLDDCATATPICKLSEYHFDFTDGNGENEKELDLQDSFIEETESVWLKFRAQSKGSLEFIIVPDQEDDDIDFVLYESALDSPCSSKKAMRIMASGTTLGAEVKQCLGTTGLRHGSIDVTEQRGCYAFSDNFLSPAELTKSKEYILVVNNFNSQAGFNIIFSSTDGLELEDNCTQKEFTNNLVVYPNPAQDLLYISLESDEVNTQESIVLYDLLGRKVMSHLVDVNTETSIDISMLPPSQYIIRTKMKDEILVKTFIKE